MCRFVIVFQWSWALKTCLSLLVDCFYIFQNKEISIMMSEMYLAFGECFVSSTSDFWWNPVVKKSFAACIANFMSHKYLFKNGLSLFMSTTTFNSLSDGDVRHLLRSRVSTLDRCQALADMVLFDRSHTGEEIGSWLEDGHRSIGCDPSYICSHVVDGAGNAGMPASLLRYCSGRLRILGSHRLSQASVMLTRLTLWASVHRVQVSTR